MVWPAEIVHALIEQKAFDLLSKGHHDFQWEISSQDHKSEKRNTKRFLFVQNEVIWYI
jgi:hypothetical protein